MDENGQCCGIGKCVVVDENQVSYEGTFHKDIGHGAGKVCLNCLKLE